MPRYMFLALIIVVSIYLFYREKQKNTNERRFNMKDPFFFSFFLTQLLAVLFFLWDEPYMHSLWHLFAFVSLGSVIVHSGNTETDEREKLIFYCLSSLPSRFFIAWIFMDWESGDGGLVDAQSESEALTALRNSDNQLYEALTLLRGINLLTPEAPTEEDDFDDSASSPFSASSIFTGLHNAL